MPSKSHGPTLATRAAVAEAAETSLSCSDTAETCRRTGPRSRERSISAIRADWSRTTSSAASSLGAARWTAVKSNRPLRGVISSGLSSWPADTAGGRAPWLSARATSATVATAARSSPTKGTLVPIHQTGPEVYFAALAECPWAAASGFLADAASPSLTCSETWTIAREAAWSSVRAW